MTTENYEELAARVSYGIIQDIAPKELPLFDDFKEEFIKNPDAFSGKNRAKREKMLGFAFPDGTTQILTGFVLPIVLQAIKNHVPKKGAKTLTDDQLRELREEAYNNAIAMGMKKEKAEVMADALVGKMMRISEVK